MDLSKTEADGELNGSMAYATTGAKGQIIITYKYTVRSLYGGLVR